MKVIDDRHAAATPEITPAWFPLRPHSVQSRLWRARARFCMVPAGRGSGKTELAKRRLVRFLPVNRGHRHTHLYAYLAPTRGQAKRVAWSSLKALCPPEWRKGLPSETELVIRTIFNSELHVIGMDKPQRFEGNQWDGVIVDECSDQKPGLFEKTIRPALTHRKGWCWMIGVPKRQGVGARDFRRFCELGFAGDDPEFASFTWPSWDILPAAEIEHARRTMDSKDFNEQYGAAWQTVGGAAYHEFNETVHVVSVPYDPTLPIMVGADFNVDPMAWVLGQSPDGKQLCIFDEVWLHDTNTIATLNVLWDRYGAIHKGGWVFHGDASGHSRQTSASMSDFAHVMRDERFGAKALWPRSHPPIKDRLSSVNAMLRNAAGEVRLHIDPRCVHLVDDLKNRGLDKTGLPVSADKENGGHVTDALGYLIHYRWPATRIEPQGEAKIGVYYGD